MKIYATKTGDEDDEEGRGEGQEEAQGQEQEAEKEHSGELEQRGGQDRQRDNAEQGAAGEDDRVEGEQETGEEGGDGGSGARSTEVAYGQAQGEDGAREEQEEREAEQRGDSREQGEARGAEHREEDVEQVPDGVEALDEGGERQVAGDEVGGGLEGEQEREGAAAEMRKGERSESSLGLGSLGASTDDDEPRPGEAKGDLAEGAEGGAEAAVGVEGDEVGAKEETAAGRPGDDEQ